MEHSAPEFVRQLLPQCVEVVEGPIPNEAPPLWSAEASCVARAVLKRRVEFACGRSFARRAVERLGLDIRAIRAGPFGAPQWPSGLIGSISHSDHYCAAAVARTSHLAAIGIDVEEIARLRLQIAPQILTSGEIETELQALPRCRQLARAVILFSAKESLYKCLHPLTGARLSFHDAEVKVDARSSTFDVALRTSAGSFAAGQSFVGRYAVRENLVATAVTVAAGSELPDERARRVSTRSPARSACATRGPALRRSSMSHRARE